MKIVALYNCKGGVASTTLAGNLVTYAAERGIRVCAATVGPEHDLEPFLGRLGLPWHDALESMPTDGDLLVLDVHSHTHCAELLRPDLWVMPMCNRTAYENATRVLPSLVGPALWVWTSGEVYSRHIAPELRARASFAPVVIPRCPSIADSVITASAAWSTPGGAHTPGARAVQALAQNILERLDMPLAPASALALGPLQRPSHANRHGFLSREARAMPALATYFARRFGAA